MKVTMSENAGNSDAEEQFVQLFCDVFGVEKDSLYTYSTPLLTFTEITELLTLQ